MVETWGMILPRFDRCHTRLMRKVARGCWRAAPVAVLMAVALGGCADTSAPTCVPVPGDTYLDGTTCAPVTACTSAEYEVARPTAVTDRECAPLSVCAVAQYESAPPTSTTDRACTPLTVCSAAEYQSTAPTTTSDRACSTLTVCTAEQFASTPATATSDRRCSPLTICAIGQYERVEPTATSDRVCAPITACTAVQFEVAPPTATSDRVCAPVRTCSASEFEVTAPTPTSDRACASLTVCTVTQYEHEPPTPTTDRGCRPRPYLSGLGISTGALAPTFDALTSAYGIDLSVAVSAITVTPHAALADSTIAVDGVSVGSGATSSPRTLALGPNSVVVTVTSVDGLATETYTVTAHRDPSLTYLKASITGGAKVFGRAVAVAADGQTLAVGAVGESGQSTGINGDQTTVGSTDSGAVYVFHRTAGAWVQEAYVKASNTGSYDEFGGAVALSADGNTMAVAAYHEASSATGIGGDQVNNGATFAGAVYIFRRTGGVWAQEAYVKASNTSSYDEFGWSLGISADGATVAVGARREESRALGINGDEADHSALDAGAVYVFRRGAGGWSQEAYVKPSNTRHGFNFGHRIALAADGAVLAVGAPYESSGATGINGDQGSTLANAGAVYVFRRGGGGWVQEAYVKASNTDGGDYFGDAVALSGDGATLAAGASGEDSNVTGVGGGQGDDSASAAGAVYVFRHDASGWAQEAYVKASNTNANDYFGARLALSLDGATLAVGAFGEDSRATGFNGDQVDDSASTAGAVYLFRRGAATWAQLAYVKASNTDPADYFGVCLALTSDGTQLAAGAPLEDSAATGINGDQTSNAAFGTGAVYLYDYGGM
jgi:hypothetical protein